MKYSLLAPFAQDLLSAPVFEAYVKHVLGLAREHAEEKNMKRILLKMNTKCYG